LWSCIINWIKLKITYLLHYHLSKHIWLIEELIPSAHTVISNLINGVLLLLVNFKALVVRGELSLFNIRVAQLEWTLQEFYSQVNSFLTLSHYGGLRSHWCIYHPKCIICQFSSIQTAIILVPCFFMSAIAIRFFSLSSDNSFSLCHIFILGVLIMTNSHIAVELLLNNILPCIALLSIFKQSILKLLQLEVLHDFLAFLLFLPQLHCLASCCRHWLVHLLVVVYVGSQVAGRFVFGGRGEFRSGDEEWLVGRSLINEGGGFDLAHTVVNTSVLGDLLGRLAFILFLWDC
jgi:hypothetical protein